MLQKVNFYVQLAMSYNKVKPAVTEKLIPDPVLMKNLTILSVRY